jgi:hypothetical protein
MSIPLFPFTGAAGCCHQPCAGRCPCPCQQGTVLSACGCKVKRFEIDCVCPCKHACGKKKHGHKKHHHDKKHHKDSCSSSSTSSSSSSSCTTDSTSSSATSCSSKSHDKKKKRRKFKFDKDVINITIITPTVPGGCDPQQGSAQTCGIGCAALATQLLGLLVTPTPTAEAIALFVTNAQAYVACRTAAGAAQSPDVVALNALLSAIALSPPGTLSPAAVAAGFVAYNALVVVCGNCGCPRPCGCAQTSCCGQ